ncbi:MAG: pirin family protein [Chitinophagales bacterium]|nr:pirin family protein [Chitinophagales bacterium]
MKTRSVEKVFAPPPPHYVGDGFRVHNFIPSLEELSMERMNPFIMMDYNSKFVFPPSKKPKGVGVHPHRGFETVTIAYKGKVAHHDSSGNSGVIGEGEVQWMTAASGILHKEYHEENFSKEGGEFQMVQLWVNLPARYKMSKPKYQGITRKDLVSVALENNAGFVEIIAGEFDGKKGPAESFTPIHMYNLHLEKDGVTKLSFNENYNTLLLVIEGSITINEAIKATSDQLVLMANDGENFSIEAKEKSIVLVLSGEALHEPIAAHGPFVMNNQREILQAFHDYNDGKFGNLED